MNFGQYCKIAQREATGLQHSFSSLAEFAPLREDFRQQLRALCPEAADRLFVALNEAVNNALFHGIREDGGKMVSVSVSKSGDAVEIIVRHNGRGLKQRVTGCGGRTGLEESGRGLHIIESCADSVSYNRAGNEMVMRAAVKG